MRGVATSSPHPLDRGGGKLDTLQAAQQRQQHSNTVARFHAACLSVYVPLLRWRLGSCSDPNGDRVDVLESYCAWSHEMPPPPKMLTQRKANWREIALYSVVFVGSHPFWPVRERVCCAASRSVTSSGDRDMHESRRLRQQRCKGLDRNISAVDRDKHDGSRPARVAAASQARWRALPLMAPPEDACPGCDEPMKPVEQKPILSTAQSITSQTASRATAFPEKRTDRVSGVRGPRT